MVTERRSGEQADARRAMPGEFLRFGVVGIVNTIVHYAVYLVLWPLLPYLVAHLAAVVTAASCSYLLNCHFTFHIHPTWHTFLRYPISNLTNIALSTISCAVLVEIFLVDPRIATIVGGLAAFPVTFLVSRIILVGSRNTA